MSFLEAVRTALEDKSNPPNLIALILFGIRILVFRLSTASLLQYFKLFYRWIVHLLQGFVKSKKYQNMTGGQIIFIQSMKLLETMIQLDLEEFNLFKHIFVFENFSAFVIDSDQNSSSEFNINPLLYNRVSNIQVNFEANKEVVDPDRYYQIQFENN